MKKNQATTEKTNTNKKSKFLSFDWIVLALFVASILSNILLFMSRPELMNPVSTLLFQLWHLIFGIYFAVRITTISLMDKTTEVQKSIAKTAIRQIRNTQIMTENLIGIVNSKTDCFQNDKMIDTLKDINNHLNSLSINIASSESAFKDILGEEFKEEHLLLTKIKESFSLLNEKAKQEKELRKKKEKEDKVRQSELKNEINELRSRISSDISSLPITGSTRLGILNIPSYQPINFSTAFKRPWEEMISDFKEIPIPSMGEGISIGKKNEKKIRKKNKKKQKR